MMRAKAGAQVLGEQPIQNAGSGGNAGEGCLAKREGRQPKTPERPLLERNEQRNSLQEY